MPHNRPFLVRATNPRLGALAVCEDLKDMPRSGFKFVDPEAADILALPLVGSLKEKN